MAVGGGVAAATGVVVGEASIPQKRRRTQRRVMVSFLLLVAKVVARPGLTLKRLTGSMDGLTIPRHGTGLAVDCLCDQIHIASGAASPGSHQELESIETFFLAGTETTCTASAPVSPNTPFPTRAPVQVPIPGPVTWALALSGNSPLKLIDVPSNEVIVDLFVRWNCDWHTNRHDPRTTPFRREFSETTFTK